MSIENFVRNLNARRREILNEMAADPKPDRWRKAKLQRELDFINDKLNLATRERIQ
jgi:hypothetical protein